MKPEVIAKLVDVECGVATVIPLAIAIAPFRVDPFVRSLRWPYGRDSLEFPCWIVADLGKKKAGLTLAYCEFGQGKSGDCWGVVAAEEKEFGRDDSWFARLEDAFISSGAWSEPLPSSYEIR